MSDQTTSGSPAPAGERGGRLGRFRSKGTPNTDRAPSGPARRGVDGLTGLPSRDVLHEWLNAAIMASRPTSSHCILVFVDLDSLRDVNDSFGPDAGDAILAEAATRLQDLGARALRYGGAEFALVYQGIDSMTAPDDLAGTILDRVTAPYDIAGGRDPVTVACHLGLAVGGDFTAPDNGAQASAYTRDGGRTWIGGGDLGGYRSGVDFISGSPRTAIAVGTSGTDVTYDGGRSWTAVEADGQGFDSVQCRPGGDCWASGADGRVGRLHR